MARIETPAERRKRRIRFKLKKHAKGSPRLTVFRSNANIHVQIIDDLKAKTLVAASTLDKEIDAKLKGKNNTAAAVAVGKLIAERAKKEKIDRVVFDRGGYLYHGRVKALADAAREAGLTF